MWQYLLESSVCGFVAIDSKHKVKLINKYALKILEWGQESEVIGQDISKFMSWPELLEVVRTGGPVYGKQTLFRTKSVLADYIPWIENEDQGVAVIFEAFQEEASQERDYFKGMYKELQAIIDSSYDGFLITDGEGRILQVNKAYERIRGLSQEQVVGKSFNELIREGVYTFSIVDEVIKEKNTVSTILSPIQNHLLFTATPIFDENKNVARIVINVRDMSELTKLRFQLETAKEQTNRYRSELDELRAQNLRTDGIVGNSLLMQKVWEISWQVAKVDSTVLITGESGVGKEIVAKVIHNQSERQKEPFIKVNCGAIPESLMESELFGYEPGAFTGAIKGGKPGLFELADKGTIFLDEIGELPLPLQVKLLRVLQEKEIMRVGGVRSRHLNVRILAATNRDLEKMVNEGSFREDLFFRLNVVPIHVPALRERTEDILPLIHHFRDFFNQKYYMKKEFAPDVIQIFLDYPWPGNIRELENIIERLMVTTPGDLITEQNLPAKFTSKKSEGPYVKVKGILPLQVVLEEAERQLVNEAMARYKSPEKVAEILGINRATVFRKLKKIRQNQLSVDPAQ